MEIATEAGGNLGDDGNVLYLDHDNGWIAVYLSKNY